MSFFYMFKLSVTDTEQYSVHSDNYYFHYFINLYIPIISIKISRQILYKSPSQWYHRHPCGARPNLLDREGFAMQVDFKFADPKCVR